MKFFAISVSLQLTVAQAASLFSEVARAEYLRSAAPDLRVSYYSNIRGVNGLIRRNDSPRFAPSRADKRSRQPRGGLAVIRAHMRMTKPDKSGRGRNGSRR